MKVSKTEGKFDAFDSYEKCMAHLVNSETLR